MTCADKTGISVALGHLCRTGWSERVTDVNSLGVPIVVRDAETLEDLGRVRVPGPVEPGDSLVLTDGRIATIVAVLETPPGASVAAAVTAHLGAARLTARGRSSL